jgi:membrane protein YqaA with SNARE-associated domain
MKRFFRFLITKASNLITKSGRWKYLVISLLTLIGIYGGIPGASTILALGSGIAECNPALIGLSISVGGGIGSAMSQKTGQVIFDKSKLSNLEIALADFAEENKTYIIPILILASVSFIPETFLYATIGKDIPKLKMFLTNLIARFLNFWLMSSLFKKYLKPKIIAIFKKIAQSMRNEKEKKL